MKSLSVLLLTAGLASAMVVPAHVSQNRRSITVIGGPAPLGAAAPVVEVPGAAVPGVGKEEKGPKDPKEAEAGKPPAPAPAPPAPPAPPAATPPPPPEGEAPPPPPPGGEAPPPEVVAPPEATPTETTISGALPEATPAETTTSEALPEATPSESTSVAPPEATPPAAPAPGEGNGRGNDDGKGRGNDRDRDDDRNRGNNGNGRGNNRDDQQLQRDLARQIQLTLGKLNVGGVLDLQALAGAGIAQSVSLLVQVQQVQVLQQLQLVTQQQAIAILGGGAVGEAAKGRVDRVDRVQGKGRGKKNDERSLIRF